MERHPAVGSKCGVGILHVCQVKNHHQERSDNNIDCSPSNLAHIKKTVTVRFILDHPVYMPLSRFPVSTGILPHSLPEWAFRERPGLWQICLCPKVARIAEHKFGCR